MAKLNDAELVSLIEQQEQSAYGYLTSTLSGERERAIQYYLGDKVGVLAAVEGRSSVVSHDVADTVHAIMPSLLKTFLAGDEVVKFDPVGPEDEQGAEIESAYVNHIVSEKNNAFGTFTSWFKDALLMPNGYVKAWWDQRVDVLEERYVGLTDDEFAMIMQDQDVEVLEHEQRQEPMMGQGMQMPMQQGMQMGQGMPMASMHDLRVRKKSSVGEVRYAACPPEEVLVAKDHRGVCLEDALFVQHRRKVTISELREMGYDVADDISDSGDEDLDTTEEAVARDRYDEQALDVEHSGVLRTVIYRENYVRMDYDGDGIAELRKVCLVGKTVLMNDTADMVPFAAISAEPMPHRHIGRSMASFVMDIQEVKTALLRSALDNQYLANNGRYAIDPARVNVADMLVSRPGGIVRTQGDPAGAIMPLVHTATGDVALAMLGYQDSIKQNRTGINEYFTGTDANALNKTARGITQLTSQAQMRVELITRQFAEGVKELCRLVHALVRKHAAAPAIFRFRNQWIPTDPRGWRTRRDMTIAVGIGTGTNMEKMGHLQTILMAQKEAMQIGATNPEKIYNALSELTKLAGFRNAEKFWSNPTQSPPPAPQKNPLVEIEEIKAQGKQAEMQMDAQQGQAKMQMDGQLEQMKMQSQMQTELQVAQIRAETEKEIAIIKAQADAQIKLGMQAQDMDKSIADQIAAALAAQAQMVAESNAQTAQALTQMAQAMAMMAQTVSAPKRVVRDREGRVSHVEPMTVQ